MKFFRKNKCPSLSSFHYFKITATSRMQHTPRRRLKRVSPSSKKSFRFGKVFTRRKEQFIPIPCFSLLGGNRFDPLNLNELIEQRKQAPSTSPTGHDPLVEILLTPDIYDPLGLDLSLYSNHQPIDDLHEQSRNR